MPPDVASPVVLFEVGYMYCQVDNYWLDLHLWMILVTWANLTLILQANINKLYIITSNNVSHTKYNFTLPIYSFIAFRILIRALAVSLSN